VDNKARTTTSQRAGEPVAGDQNGQVFNTEHVVRQYRRDAVLNGCFLDAGERSALLEVAPTVRGRPILDVGVGTGRTTPLLQLLSDDYLAVDYAPEMVATFVEHHPGVRCECRDARDLSAYPDNSFGLIYFSNNAIDAVSHDDRSVVLREFRRLLAPGGRVVFSTLNMYGPTRGEHPMQLTRPTQPLRLDARVRIKSIGRRVLDPMSFVRAIQGWRRHRKLAVDHQTWAVGPIAAHDYQLMVHFTTLTDLFDLVEHSGLQVLSIYSETGARISREHDAYGIDDFNVVATHAE
jgi:SAM-dependent methyltransferase